MTSTLCGRRSSSTGMTPGITENSGQPRRDHSGRDPEFEDDRGRDSFRGDGHERALYFDRAVRIPRRSTSPASTASSTPLSWLDKCDNYFCGHRTLEEENIRQASFHLDGAAAYW